MQGLVTPYRQRNEARQQVEQLISPANNSKYYERNAEIALSNHWDDLAILSEEVASKLSIPFSIDNRYILLSNEVDKEDDGIKALMFIDHWEDMDNQIEQAKEGTETVKEIKADWSLYPHLQKHLIAEDPEWETKMARLKDVAVILHKKLYSLTQVAIGIAKTWNIILGADWVIDGVINAGNLSSPLQEALIPMNSEVMQAYNECYEALQPIHDYLHNVARRRTFRGKCPICP